MLTNKLLIFVMEDDIPCGKLVQYYLSKHGFKKVMHFDNEKLCLSNMKLRPDILITDFRLKSTNGINLAKRAKRIHPDLYCILLSGMREEEIFTDKYSRCYVDKYISKGLNSLDELLITLNSHLHTQYVEYLHPDSSSLSICTKKISSTKLVKLNPQ